MAKNTYTRIIVLPSARHIEKHPTVSLSEQQKIRAIFERVAAKYNMLPAPLGYPDNNLERKSYIFKTRSNSGPQVILGWGSFGIEHGSKPNYTVEEAIQKDIVSQLSSVFGNKRVRVDVLPKGIAF